MGQCAQTTHHPNDMLGSWTVLDLCEDMDAVEMFWGIGELGMAVAVADIEEVDCEE